MNSHVRPRRGRNGLAMTAAIGAVLLVSACGSSTNAGGGSGSSNGGGTTDSNKKITIAFAQAFSSNSWQTANNAAVQQAVDELNAQGKNIDYKFLDANNDVATQISQISDLILEKVDVIMVDPVSSSGINGVVDKAIAAGIPVLDFADGPITSTKPYEMEGPLKQYELDSAAYIAKRLNGVGNVLDIRGVAGSGGDQTMEDGVQEGFKPYPGIKIVGSVYGNWDEATTQTKVAQLLPSLPKVDAVIQQGGEGFGVAQAFEAAGRPVPLIVMGNRQEELQWWDDENKKNGYTTISITANPGIGASAVHIAYDLATGKNPPGRVMVFPNLTITQDTLKDYLNLPKGGVASKAYDYDWTEANVVSKATN